MISSRTIVLLILQATLFGCVTGGKGKVVHNIEPALSNTMSCEELVDYLNSQNEGLHGWRCMETQVHVSMPGIPLPQNLKGSLSCSEPKNFRLTADNFVAMADFGSNDDICWAYSKPGEPAVLTWDHEDSHLLEYVPGNFPRLDPEWLMVILGIQRLDSSQFQLQKPPAGSRELWLVAIEDSSTGQPIRRVIKVDTLRGFAREHALIDHNGTHLLRAQLSNHRTCSGHVLPHTVKISFPPQKTELTLNFKSIEPNCRIAEGLWTPPGGDRIAQIDLGDYVRQMHGDLPPKRSRQSSAVAEVASDNRMLDGQSFDRQSFDDSIFDETPQTKRNKSAEPDFDSNPLSNEALFSSDDTTDGRFFVQEGSDEFDPAFPNSISRESDTPAFDSHAPIHETGFLEEPDFDTVAPTKPPAKPPTKSRRRWFGLNVNR